MGTDRGRRLAAQPARQAPARKYSPDGRRLVFFSERDGIPSLYSIAADGTDLRRLTTEGTSYEAAWSPDGTRIAFYSNRTGRYELYLMNADGTNQRATHEHRLRQRVATVVARRLADRVRLHARWRLGALHHGGPTGPNRGA